MYQPRDRRLPKRQAVIFVSSPIFLKDLECLQCFLPVIISIRCHPADVRRQLGQSTTCVSYVRWNLLEREGDGRWGKLHLQKWFVVHFLPSTNLMPRVDWMIFFKESQLHTSSSDANRLFSSPGPHRDKLPLHSWQKHVDKWVVLRVASLEGIHMLLVSRKYMNISINEAYELEGAHLPYKIKRPFATVLSGQGEGGGTWGQSCF